ncbi:hypothetical protein A0J61_08944 [Choanephora cucurbitarum]|uniref:Uncharacterized protein n=1 Tax=Choanephora cucurbitarum TaxID=101091 RepID=A0A1C7N1N8_9FUNG|nr:hypothetical protein A0J61_08944 [Choanephora cucurbitarum]
MSNFFNGENSENWSFASFLSQNNVSNKEGFNKAKLKYLSEMQKISDPGLKRLAKQHIKEATKMKFVPKSHSPANIDIRGDVTDSIIGSSSCVLKINNNRDNISLASSPNVFYHVDSEQDIWDLWHQFFKECKADESMHEFSLEKVGIIQCGYKVKMRSNLVKELYDYINPREPNPTNAFSDYEDDMSHIFSSTSLATFVSRLKEFKRKKMEDKNALFLSKVIKLILEVPLDSQKQIWMKKSEANYSEYFIWQLLKAVSKFSSNSSLFFQIGEYKLESIKHEIERRNDDKLKDCSYNADGCHTTIVGGKNVELSLLEVTGAFGITDVSRGTKDHIKGCFGALAMLQEIAHLFSFGSIEAFYSIRVFFVQALNQDIRLWSLEQVSKGVCVMELIETATVPTNFADIETYIRDICNLMWLYKNGLEKSIRQIEQLQREDREVRLKISRKLISPKNANNLVTSLEKHCILKIKGEHISGYNKLKVMASQ